MTECPSTVLELVCGPCAHEFILMSVERQKKLANAAVQKTDFGTSDGRGCTVVDLVSRRSMIDIKWPRASSYVLKTAIFPVTPPSIAHRPLRMGPWVAAV